MKAKHAALRVALAALLLAGPCGPAEANDAPALERRVEESTRLRGAKDPETLGVLAELALAKEASGSYAESARLHERVLKLRLEVLERHHPDTLETMRGLARVWFHLGRHQEGVALLERAVAASRERFGGRAPETLDAMASLVKGYTLLGHEGEALPLAEEVVRGNREVRIEGHPATFFATADLAAIYRALGHAQQSLEVERRMLADAVKRWGERSPQALHALQAVADSLLALRRFGEAVPLMERSLALRTAVHGERSTETAFVFTGLASAYGALGRREEQLQMASRALEAGQTLYGERHVQTAHAMYALALAHGALDRNKEAAALLEKVLEARTELRGEGHPETLQALSALAVSYERSGRLEDAAALAPRYVAAAERRRTQANLSPEGRRAVFQRYARGYRYFSWLHDRVRRGEEGFLLLELGKARSLLDAMAAQRADRAGAIPPEEQVRLAALERLAETREVAALASLDPDERRRLEAQRLQAHRTVEAVRVELKRKYPKFAQLSSVRPVRAIELGGLIEPGAVAVSYGVGTDENELSNVFAWVSDGTGLWFIDLRSFLYLDELVDAVRRASSHPRGLHGMQADQGVRVWRLPENAGYRLLPASEAPPKGAEPARHLEEISRYCTARLLEPIKAQLRGKTRWIISPDGPLAQLPFEVLPWGDEGKPAVMAADIHYVQSMSVMALAKARGKEYATMADRRALFAMGNPVYGPVSQPTGSERAARSAAVRSASRLRDLDALWPNLPGTEREVRAVAAVFGSESSIHLGAQATEHQLRSLNAKGELARYRYLLFSAHGYLSEAEPALSSLVLGLVDRAPGTDGYVTAAEWPGYDLRSDVAVLSACDTGLGRISSGDGVMGLPFALFVAGNVNTVLSLWPVEDEATVEFMKALFTRLKAGVPPARALGETKRAFITNPPQKRFSAPNVWAPFILIGPG